MALKTAIGGRDSNSYCTLSEGYGYIQLLGLDLTDWENQETAQQEYCYTLAAQMMQYFPWDGSRVYRGQALDFPRTSQDNVEEYPVEIKQAQAQIAFNVIFRALQALANQPSEGAVDLSKVRQVSLGGLLSVSFTDGPSKGGTILDMLTRSLQFPIYLAVTRWISQVRGGRVAAEEETCLTTSTTTSTTTTSTTSTTSTSTTTTT